MESGKLKHRITIQAATETRNDTGDVLKSWATFADRWASIEPLTGRELMKAQQVSSEVTHKVTIRYLAGVTPQHRILFGSRVFNINSVLDSMEQHKELVLMCNE